MTIIYPLDFPTTIKPSSFSIELKKAVAVTESQFTYAQQVQEHQGEAWQISVSLDLLNRDQAEEFNAFILKLAGRVGVFTMSIAGSETARGVATGTPLVDGANQTGRVLNVKGWTPNISGILKAGDFIQLGTGLSTRLHKVLDTVDSDANGDATLLLAPKITTAPNNEQAIIVQNAKGLFRLKSNATPTSIKPPNQQTISFRASEVR